MDELDYQQIAPKVNALLALAAGMNLVQARLTPRGFEMIYENTEQRVEIHLYPRIYPDGRLITDAVNDLTLLVEVRRSSLAGTEKAVEERIELPYSTWFGEDFLEKSTRRLPKP
jgi:hypothetical protein